MLLEPTPPGTSLGEVRPAVREECGLGAVPVILPATHDTACAVVAVPAAPRPAGEGHAYISSGTWSLLGLELRHPILSEEARLAGFTHEGGAGGTYCFLTNIMGLWLVQECRRVWARLGMSWSYEELTARAAAVTSPGVVLDVDDPAFLHPADMPAAINGQLTRTGQKTMHDPVELVRAIFEGLALKYRVALERAEQLSGSRVRVIHVVGGGARNELLCQLTADACGRSVAAGPAEATALGNVLVQAMGCGEVRSLAEAHAIARSSARLRVHEPRGSSGWDERHARLASLA
jgi:rhamnulokinase